MNQFINKLQLSESELNIIIDKALNEDIGYGDVTSEILIPPDLSGKALIIAKETGILAGGEVAKRIFSRIDSGIEFQLCIGDGLRLKRGDIIATVTGRLTSILKAERVALNFLQRLSGIASMTDMYIAKIQGYNTCITDTRKTTPGLRALEKYAVLIGGGYNHRFHLGDGVLIKDNHLLAMHTLDMSIKDIILKARKGIHPDEKIEVEVNTIKEAIEAVDTGANIILMDNMSTKEMNKVVKLVSGKVKTEASGNINLTNVRSIAATGVNIISIGKLTHSSIALDICLDLDPQTVRSS